MISYGTDQKKRAEEIHRRAMSKLWELENGITTIPPGQEIADWLLGRSPSPTRTLEDSIQAYRDARAEGTHAVSTVKTEDLHLGHLGRILGSAPVQSIAPRHLAEYRDRRLAQVSGATVRKEISTFRVLWRWVVGQSIAQGSDPSAGLAIPKPPRAEPFRTLADVERMTEGLDDTQAQAYWDSCVLVAGELSELLAVVDHRAPHWIKGAIYACALAGVRRSEWIRSRPEDWDIGRGTLIVRERKRVKSRQGSTRTVAIHPTLDRVIREHLTKHPGGSVMFGLDPSKRITRDQAVHYWREMFRGSRFERLRGYHVLRHSFASNLAAAGVRADLIDRWMGHQTQEMRERYRHFFPQEETESIARLDVR
jgi:integrase